MLTDYFDMSEVLDFISEGLLYTDLEGKIISISGGGARAFGYGAPEELVGKKLRDLYAAPEDCDRLYEITKKTGELGDYVIAARKRDGSPIEIEARSRLRLDESGSPAGVATLFRDITERELYRRAVQRAEDRYQQLFNSISEGYVRFGPDNAVVFINPAGARILGFESPQAAIGRMLFDRWENAEECGTYLEGLRQSGRAVKVSFRFRTVGGKTITLEISERLVKGRDGALIGSDALFTDVTEEARLRAELEQSVEMHRKVLQNCSELVLAVDRDTTIRFANNAILRLLGYTPEEVEGKPAYFFVPPEEHELIEPVRRQFYEEGKTVKDFRIHAVSRHGLRMPLSWMALPVKPPLPDGTDVVLIATNITEILALEKKLAESEKNP